MSLHLGVDLVEGWWVHPGCGGDREESTAFSGKGGETGVESLAVSRVEAVGVGAGGAVSTLKVRLWCQVLQRARVSWESP